MQEERSRARLETEEIVIGYAMSRLDSVYYSARGFGTWERAYAEAGTALSRPPDTFKNLRDEFDPVHSNPRVGRNRRPMRPNRQRVLDELADVSDEALLELVDRILRRDEAATEEAIDSLAVVNKVAHNVAERLLTGRRAEEYFLDNSMALVQIERAALLDLRQNACGYDFGVQANRDIAIEVKGIKEHRGDIQFTDREWSEAKLRGANYWVVVVGNLAATTSSKVIPDPHAVLKVTSRFRRSIAVEWRSRVIVTP